MLESPSLEKSGDLNAFARNMTLAASDVPQVLMVAEAIDRKEEKKEETVEVDQTVEENGKKIKKKVKQQKTITTAVDSPAVGTIENGIAHAAGLHAAAVGAEGLTLKSSMARFI